MNFTDFLEERYDGPIARDEERELARKSNLTLDRRTIDKWTVWSRTHASARAYQRMPEVTKAEWLQLINLVVEKVGTFDKLTKEKEFLFHSRKMNLGFVAAVDPPKNEIRIISVLEPGAKSIRKAGTTWIQLP